MINKLRNDSINNIIFREKQFITFSTLKKEKINYKNLPKESYNDANIIFLFILFIMTGIIAVVKSSYSKFLDYLVDSFNNYKISKRFFNEKNITFNRISIVFDFVFLINFSLFLFIVYSFLTDKKEIDFFQFLDIVFLVIGYTLVKNLIQKIISYIFNCRLLVSEYIFQKSVLNKWLGIILLPFNFLMFFINKTLFISLLYITILIIIVFYIIKLIRSIKLIYENNVKFYHALMFYIIFEILPIIIIFKILLILQKN